MPRKPDASRPWLPIALTKDDATIVAGIKAFAIGKANAGQQQAVYRFIVERLCGYLDLSYRPDDLGGERDTAFAEGRRFVGQQIEKIRNVPAPVLLGGE